MKLYRILIKRSNILEVDSSLSDCGLFSCIQGKFEATKMHAMHTDCAHPVTMHTFVQKYIKHPSVNYNSTWSYNSQLFMKILKAHKNQQFRYFLSFFCSLL